MSRLLPVLLISAILLAACSAIPFGEDAKQEQTGTIAQLREKNIEIKEVEIEGGFEKAMASYQHFLEESEDSELAPEATRRLADLKIEKEYGHLVAQGEAVQEVVEPEATGGEEPAGSEAGRGDDISSRDDLIRPGALDAVALYEKLLEKYPQYERNDEVLYQLARAYEELGRVEEAMEVMDRLVRDFPDSQYIDEVQFRRAEHFFTRRLYLDAEEAYKSVVDIGDGSFFFQLALYKLGWTYYKQELYGEAQDRFIALLDYKVKTGYDFDQTGDLTEKKRMEDTFRVISLGFSSIGGPEAVVEYFSSHGGKSYEDRVYSNLAEYYFDKRRFSDATETYNDFISRNPFHEKAPNFLMRVIEINIAGGFPTLVLEEKKAFANTYGLEAEYWQHYEPVARPDVLGFLKTNLKDLAYHYHALYQDQEHAEDRLANFSEALHWYRQYIASFPGDAETPEIHYQLASLLTENGLLADAAVEYEKTAYNYPLHEKSAEAGYMAVFAYRQYLESVPDGAKTEVRKKVVRSSLLFAETFPEHEKAPIVLGAAAVDLDDMGDYAQAYPAALKLVEEFPETDQEILRRSWLVVAHSAFELQMFSEAETGYEAVLNLLPADEEEDSRTALVDNLAISIYKQGEEAEAREDYRAAADLYLRVGEKAPASKYRPNAEYDAATALITLKDWPLAATVLSRFREEYPGHELQPDVTKKIAFVYKEDGQLSSAAGEYERIERESRDDEVRREALLVAADLYEEVGDVDRVLGVYQRYVEYFPDPVDMNLDLRNKISEILKKRGSRDQYLAELRKIVKIEAAAGEGRTADTRYIAGKAALVLAELDFDRFVAIELVKPFDANLKKKQESMKQATQVLGKLLEYEVGEVTAAATFYLAEAFANFNKSLLESERPEGLSPLEAEEYELAIEDQAYPFEEKAISVHQSNLELISRGIYNEWIEKSLSKLAKLVPARYDKPEEESGPIVAPDSFSFAYGTPRPPEPQVAEIGAGESALAAEGDATIEGTEGVIATPGGAEGGPAAEMPESVESGGEPAPESITAPDGNGEAPEVETLAEPPGGVPATASPSSGAGGAGAETPEILAPGELLTPGQPSGVGGSVEVPALAGPMEIPETKPEMVQPAGAEAGPVSETPETMETPGGTTAGQTTEPLAVGEKEGEALSQPGISAVEHAPEEKAESESPALEGEPRDLAGARSQEAATTGEGFGKKGVGTGEGR